MHFSVSVLFLYVQTCEHLLLIIGYTYHWLGSSLYPFGAFHLIILYCIHACMLGGNLTKQLIASLQRDVTGSFPRGWCYWSMHKHKVKPEYNNLIASLRYRISRENEKGSDCQFTSSSRQNFAYNWTCIQEGFRYFAHRTSEASRRR